MTFQFKLITICFILYLEYWKDGMLEQRVRRNVADSLPGIPLFQYSIIPENRKK
jgi:hypothetical protein